MRRWIICIAAAGLAAGGQAVQADTGVMVGLAYTFGAKGGGGVGITLKLLSTRKEDSWAGAAGVTYYPWSHGNPFGVDVGVGYVFDNAVVTAGWDFLHSPQISVGWMDTKDESTSSGGGTIVPGEAPPSPGPGKE